MTEIQICCRQLDEMLELQAAYDSRCFAVNKVLGKYRDTDLSMALADEMGELIHELKPSWCWWGRGRGEVNREAVLDEWADCVHFILAKVLASTSPEQNSFKRAFKGRLKDTYFPIQTRVLPLEMLDSIPAALSKLLDKTTDHAYSRALALITVTLRLGFTWPEVYEAYKAKNKVNHERLDLLEGAGDAQKALTEGGVTA